MIHISHKEMTAGFVLLAIASLISLVSYSAVANDFSDIPGKESSDAGNETTKAATMKWAAAALPFTILATFVTCFFAYRKGNQNKH